MGIEAQRVVDAGAAGARRGEKSHFKERQPNVRQLGVGPTTRKWQSAQTVGSNCLLASKEAKGAVIHDAQGTGKRKHSLLHQRTFWLAVATSMLYVFLVARYVMRMASVPELNASARNYLWGVLSMTIVLYGICVAIGISQRHRREAPVPVVGAALFGSFICVLFYGP